MPFRALAQHDVYLASRTKRNNKHSKILECSFVCSITGLTNMKIFLKKNHLDIHFRDIINKNVISGVLTSY